MKSLRRSLLLPLAMLIPGQAARAADEIPVNQDEAAVPPYVLPDPLVANDGTRVRDAADWAARRRPELLELFAAQVYGRTPAGRPAEMHWRETSVDRAALNGAATRRELTVWFSRDEAGPRMQLLIYQPNAAKAPPPVFLGLNFEGNHTVHADPGIAPAESWVENDSKHGITNHRASAAMRGSWAGRWQVETVIARGYATVTVYRGDLCPDHAGGLPAGPARLYSATPGAEERAPDAWGAIGVWAWGLSRALDVILADPSLDGRRVVVHGHSRLGKAALWAGAQDERFAAVISNDSGCGGAALSKRVFGETVAHINRNFPHWFARTFRRYDRNEAALPVDQHELLALIAPRPLYVASATEDLWADPRGEFLSACAADPVYALLGRRGLGAENPPPPSTPIGETVRYHLRPGPHDITAYDWARYLDAADQWFGRR